MVASTRLAFENGHVLFGKASPRFWAAFGGGSVCDLRHGSESLQRRVAD